MDQQVLDAAVKIATRNALNGKPASRIIWMPPETPSQDPLGTFVVEDYNYESVTDTPPWEK